jgi:hypothetical protein
MTINTVKVSESQERLMNAIGEAVRLHTMTSPMLLEEIVGVLAFAVGGAIAQTDRRLTKSELRRMAIANIDNGITAILGSGSGSIILPN